MPEIVSGGDIEGQDQMTLTELAAANLPIQNSFARNNLNNMGYAKSINHLSEKAATLGGARTISSELQ